MKTLILALMIPFLSTPAFAGENGFTCESRWYRDAELSVSSGTVTVKDSYIHGFPEVAKIVEEKMKLEDDEYTVNTIALTVDRAQGVSCDAEGLLVSCHGSAAKAWLVVRGWIHSKDISGELNLTLPVELKDFRLKTSLGSDGPIGISGDKPTTIRLNHLNLAASAKVMLHGQEVDLAWEPFFNPRNDQTSGSFCREY